MRAFYKGFEKEAGVKEKAKSVGRGIFNYVYGGLKGGERIKRKYVAATSARDIEHVSKNTAQIFTDKFKKEIMPEVNKAIDKAQKGGIGINIEPLKTLKGGILPAVAVGAGFEAGRRALDAATKLPDYTKKKRENYQSRKR